MQKYQVVQRPHQTLAGFTCDFCGKEYNDANWPHDGFSFQYRANEEDELVIEAKDMCDECYYGEDDAGLERLTELMPKVLELLKEIAPYAQVRSAGWGVEAQAEDG